MTITEKWKKIRYGFLISLFIFLLIFLFLWPRIVISVRSGEAGILYSRFAGGTDTSKVYSEGIHFIFPWNTMYIYSIRIQEKSDEFSVLARDGLSITVSASLRYHIQKNRLPELHQLVGPEFDDKLIQPIFISSLREAIGHFRPEELYSASRQKIQDIALIEAIEEMGRIPIVLDAIIIKHLTLPETLNAAIERKMVQEQEVLTYAYLLEKTKMEAKRRTVEGMGERMYQNLVNPGMQDNFLRWAGIQATKELALSENTKVVVVGGKDGLPLILNPDSPASTPINASKAGPVSTTATSVQPATLPARNETLPDASAQMLENNDQVDSLLDRLLSASWPWDDINATMTQQK